MMSYARGVYRAALPNLIGRRNVVACGLGYKVRGGQLTRELSLVVSVTQKVPAAQLAPKDLVPKSVNGFATDVIETGRIRALALDPRTRYRPAQPGISIGHYAVTAGTLGLIVQKQGIYYILSNNHVLAAHNDAHLGDPIYQPAPADGGTPADTIATLAEYAPLNFGEQASKCPVAGFVARALNGCARLVGSQHRLHPILATSALNGLDAALAHPTSPDAVTAAILGIGLPSGVADPQLRMAVQKMGRTTEYTQGVITQVDVTVEVEYSGRVARFTDQVFASRMSAPGDSGAVVVDLQRRAVGLLFAGSDAVTIMTPMSRVLSYFGAELLA